MFKPLNKYFNDTINFDLNKFKYLSPVDAKQYITRYFVPLSNGTHAMYIDGQYVIREDQEIKRTYFNRMSKELSNYYFNEYTDIRTVAYDLNKPLFYDDKINLCPNMLYTYDAKFIETITNDTRTSLNFFLDYMKDILCSGNEDSYNYLLKWIANMLHGNKNKSCVYLKGVQGVGKSTLFLFLKEHVIGKLLCLSTGSDPIRTKFNEMLGGKLLVCFEELENFSKAEWESISSRLKDMITNDSINLQNKCTKSYETTNINNYMLCSNNDAVKDDDGRRYFILDISSKRQGDHTYYSKLYKDCFTSEVGQAFFNYVYGMDIRGFNSQIIPITQSKKDAYSKRLDNVYKFIKECYILKSKGFDIRVKELYSYYTGFTVKHHSIEDFNKRMVEVGIIKHKVDKHYYYTVTFEELLKIATNKHWISELDEFVVDDSSSDEQP
jgi:hypothetical protein